MKVAIVLMGLILAGTVSCSEAVPIEDSPPPAPTGEGDSAGRAACALFQSVASDAQGEALSESEVASGLEEVGRVGEDSTNRSIKTNAVEVAAEANVLSMINGEPNGPQDALAEACQRAYPT